jgi:hypothetical protein
VILVRFFPTLMTILILLTAPAMSAELFRYRGAARDGGTLEYFFESDEQDVPKVTKEKVAETAADFMTSFYGIQVRLLKIRPRSVLNTSRQIKPPPV